MRTPTWREVEEFCQKDGWKHVRDTNHSFFQKVLEDGVVLETHRSFSAKKTMSPGRFSLILRDQLRVSQEAFWNTLRTRNAASRPSAPLPESPATLPAWLVRALRREVGMSEKDIVVLDAVAAQELLNQHRSKRAE